ncbi:hypothetical protein C1645_787200 [Glomus cerebriforme]|uniref:Uncharacterized protein n=1 Tax=Glomus cerebriforme TaxID=658196 RepID=A0A397S9N0_9GLOM|nr:hypothetical protein C1645_787200 [Glomus cerebriforme]
MKPIFFLLITLIALFALSLIDAAQEVIKDVVITVPSYYNQFGKPAIQDTGLHVLSLINGVTADAFKIGLNYAISHHTVEKEFNYFDKIARKNITESIIQEKNIKLNSQEKEVEESRPIANPGCEDGCYQTYLTACTLCSAGFINPAVYATCMALAATVYAACLVACRA